MTTGRSASGDAWARDDRTSRIFHADLLCEKGRLSMKSFLATAALAIVVATPCQAQVELKTYANPDGYIDVQALTCAQLANTYQEDADHLTAWYSGWYNGLAKKHMMKVDRAKDLEHEIIVYCKANQDKKVIQAIDVVFNQYRDQNGIKMKK